MAPVVLTLGSRAAAAAAVLPGILVGDVGISRHLAGVAAVASGTALAGAAVTWSYGSARTFSYGSSHEFSYGSSHEFSYGSSHEFSYRGVPG